MQTSINHDFSVEFDQFDFSWRGGCCDLKAEVSKFK